MVANFRAKHTVSEEPLALFLAEQDGTAAAKLNKHNYSQNVLQLDVNLYALPTAALAFLANHSCQPNTYFATDSTGLYLRALMPIPKGTEITFDYASMIFDEYTLTCLGGIYGGCKKPDGAGPLIHAPPYFIASLAVCNHSPTVSFCLILFC